MYDGKRCCAVSYILLWSSWHLHRTGRLQVRLPVVRGTLQQPERKTGGTRSLLAWVGCSDRHLDLRCARRSVHIRGCMICLLTTVALLRYCVVGGCCGFVWFGVSRLSRLAHASLRYPMLPPRSLSRTHVFHRRSLRRAHEQQRGRTYLRTDKWLALCGISLRQQTILRMAEICLVGPWNPFKTSCTAAYQ